MAAPRALGQFLIRFSPPGWFVESLRTRFPDVEFHVLPDERFHKRLPSADAIMTWTLTRDEVEAAPSLSWVQWIGAGVEDAPLQAFRDRGILLTNNRGVHAPNMAEHVLAMMLSFTRALPFLSARQRERHWADDEGRSRVRELGGSRLLIIGAGKIGQALASRAAALGVEVTLVSRTGKQSAEAEIDLRSVGSLDDLLPAADHVVLCVPHTAETNALLDERRIGLMKPGAYVYNVGRGSAIDTAALTEALQTAHLSGAGLDVTDPEPLPADHPFWEMEQVILTAHTAGATPRYWARASEILTENIDRFRRGEDLVNTVNVDLGY